LRLTAEPSSRFGEEKDAGAGAEIAELKRNEQLDDSPAAGSKLVMLSVLGTPADPARDPSAHPENQGGDQEPPRPHRINVACGVINRVYAPRMPPRITVAVRGTSIQAAKLVPLGPDAGRLSRPQGYGVDGPGNEHSDKQNRGVGNVHKDESRYYQPGMKNTKGNPLELVTR
jgi:hypothetical protein